MIRLLALTLALAVALPIPAEAGWFRRCHRARPVACVPRCGVPAPMAGPIYAPAAPTPQASFQALSLAPASVAPQPVQGPAQFLGWLNGVRARHGLRPVAWDAGLAADAAANSARGFGHFGMGRARRQNAGWGPLPTVEAMWLAHPPHASALLDPTITRVGLAGIGNVWTYNAS